MSGAGAALLAGATLAFERLRARAGAFVLGLALAAVVTAGLVERARAPRSAPDRVLGFAMSFVVPLVALALVSLATRAERLGASVWCLARYGASRRALGLGLVVVTSAAAALFAVLVVEAGLFVAYRGAPGGDALTSAWIAALGGAAYACLAFVGSRFLRAGRGRYLLLACDALAGSAAPWGLPWPRAHLVSLLGGPNAFGVTQVGSSLCLAALVLAFGLGAALTQRD